MHIPEQSKKVVEFRPPPKNRKDLKGMLEVNIYSITKLIYFLPLSPGVKSWLRSPIPIFLPDDDRRARRQKTNGPPVASGILGAGGELLEQKVMRPIPPRASVIFPGRRGTQ